MQFITYYQVYPFLFQFEKLKKNILKKMAGSIYNIYNSFSKTMLQIIYFCVENAALIFFFFIFIVNLYLLLVVVN